MGDAVPRVGTWPAYHHFHCAGVAKKAGTRSCGRWLTRRRRGSGSCSYSGPQGHRNMTVAILACAMVTLGTLFYVFYLPGTLHMRPDKTRLAYLQERKDAVYENL